MSKFWLKFPPIHLVASSFVKSPDSSGKSSNKLSPDIIKDPEQRFNSSMMMGMTNPDVSGKMLPKGSREYNQHLDFLNRLKQVGDLDTINDANIDHLFEKITDKKK